MGKYYAVKKCKIPGIYNTWDDCKSQVYRFSGAKYKSFKSIDDANKYMTDLDGKNVNICITNSDGASIKKFTQSTTSNDLHIYTDGSHIKGGGYIGYGAYCEYKSVKYYLSGNIDDKILSDYGITNTVVSNPTAEFLAFAEVIKIISSINVKITFFIDYIGVSNWMSGKWKTKASYIKKIKDVTNDIIKKNNLSVDVKHVPGHSGNYGNDQADLMAKSETNINTFGELVLALKNED